jgi:hypothetical protein
MPRSESSVPRAASEAPVVLVWAPAAVTQVPSADAARSTSTTCAASCARTTASGGSHRPDASRA